MCVQIQSNACSDCAQHLKQFRQTKHFELKPIFYGLGLRLYWTTRRGIQSDRLRCSCLYFKTSQAAHAMLRTDWNASSHLQWTKQTLDCAHFVSGKICQIQSDQAFETLGLASLRIYYWLRMKLATFPWKRKIARKLILIFWSYSGGHNAELEIWISARRNITISPPLWERCARWKEAEGGLPAMHTSQSEFDFVTVLNVTVVQSTIVTSKYTYIYT